MVIRHRTSNGICGTAMLVVLCAGANRLDATPVQRIYDENDTQTNRVDEVAIGSTLDDERLGARVRTAFDHDLGGVIDGSVLGAFHEYGVSESKTLRITAPFGVGSPMTSPMTISGTGAFASTSPNYQLTSVDFVELTGAGPGEQVVEFGLTALSVTGRDYGNVGVVGKLAGGGSVAASRPINEAAGAGDTFFGFTAPAGKHFTGFDLTYDGPVASPDFRLWFDDIGFRTAKVGQQRFETTPVVDAQAETSDGSNWFVTDGSTSGIIVEKSVDSPNPSEQDDEVLGILEFDVSALVSAQSVESALLELDVNLTEFRSGIGSPIIEAYAYVGDGLATSSDPNESTTLIGTSHMVDSVGNLAIQLDTAYLETIAGTDFVGLLLRAGNPNSVTMRFDTTEFVAIFPSAIAATLTVDFTPIPEPPSASLVLITALFAAGRGRRCASHAAGPGGTKTENLPALSGAGP